MKKIIRYSLVLAFGCVALLNTGCTKDYSSDIAAVKKDLTDFQNGAFKTVQDQVNDLIGQVENLQKADETINNTLNDLKAKDESLQKNIDNLKLQEENFEKETAAAINDLKAKDDNLQKQIDDLKNQGTTYSAQIAALQKQDETFKSQIAALEKQDENFKSQIETLQKQDETFKKAISDLQSQDVIIKKDIEDIKADIKKLQDEKADITYVEATFATKKDVEKVVKDLAALSAKFEALVPVVEKNSQDIKVNAQKIAENGKRIDKNAADISTNTANIATNAANIAKNLEAIQKNAEDIKVLYTKYEEVLVIAKDGQEKAIKALDWLGTLQGEVDTLQGEVDELEIYVYSLYTNAEIDQKIADLETKIQELKEATEKQIQELKEATEKQIKELNTKIEEFKKECAETYATKQELEDAQKAINERINSLESDVNAKIVAIGARIDGVEAAYKAADEELRKADEALRNDLNQAKADLEKAIADGDEALQIKINKNIEDIERNLQAIRKNAEDIKIANENIQKNADAIAAEAKEGGNRDLAIQKAIDKEIQDRNAAIAAAALELDNRCKAIENKLADVAGRVVSISALPSTKADVTSYSFGEEISNILEVNFLVMPAEKATCFTKENIEVLLEDGIVKTSGVTIEEILNVEGKAGVVSVRAKISGESALQATYYALKFKGSDNQGEYSIASDFAKMVKDGEIYDLVENGMFDVLWYDGVKFFKEVVKPAFTCGYDKAAGINEQPYKGYELKLIGSINGGDPAPREADWFYTNFGIKISEPVLKAIGTEDTKPFTFLNEDNLAQGNVKADTSVEDYSKYVGVEKTFGLTGITINGVDFERPFSQSFKLTKIQVPETLASIEVKWNYLNWNNGKHSYSVVSDNWDKGVFVTADPMFPVFTEKYTTVPFAVADPTFTAATIDFTGVEFGEEVVEDKAIVTKEDAANTYIFTIPATVGVAHGSKYTVNVDLGQLPEVAITKDTPLNYDFLTKAIEDSEGLNSYVAGLSGKAAEMSDLLDSLASEANSAGAFNNVKLNGENITLVKNSLAVDDQNITLPAGAINYGKDYTLTAVVNAFGIEYDFVITFSTGIAPYKLMLTPYVTENDSVGVVIGKVNESNVYAIEDMYSNKYMRIKGDPTNEKAESIFVKVEFVYERDLNDPDIDPIMPGATGELRKDSEYIKIGSKVEGTVDEYSLYELIPWKWYTYAGLKVKVKAQLCVGESKVPVGKVEKYWLKTDKPVKLEVKEIEATRQAATNLYVNVGSTEYITVNGLIEGKYTSENIFTGENTFSKDYGCDITYDFSGMKAKLNGQDYTLKHGVDFDYGYKSDDREILITPEEAAKNGKIIFKGDNCKAGMEIKVPINLNYYLDYSHDEAFKKDSVLIKIIQ